MSRLLPIATMSGDHQSVISRRLPTTNGDHQSVINRMLPTTSGDRQSVISRELLTKSGEHQSVISRKLHVPTMKLLPLQYISTNVLVYTMHNYILVFSFQPFHQILWIPYSTVAVPYSLSVRIFLKVGIQLLSMKWLTTK